MYHLHFLIISKNVVKDTKIWVVNLLALYVNRSSGTFHFGSCLFTSIFLLLMGLCTLSALTQNANDNP